MKGKLLLESAEASLWDMSEKDYFSDPCETPSITQSIAKKILTASPLHAWIYHPKLGGKTFEPSKEMQFGTIFHGLLLNKHVDITILNHDSYRSKAAQCERDNAVALGSIPILEHEWDEIQVAAESVIDQLIAIDLEIHEHREVVGIWKEKTAIGEVLCRCRMDAVDLELASIQDIKTTVSAEPGYLSRAIDNFCYDVQNAAYRSFIRKLLPDLAGREEFTWIFIEKMHADSPVKSIINPCTASAATKEIGTRRWMRACGVWAQCLATEEWPSYTVGKQRSILDMPSWRVREELAHESENGTDFFSQASDS